MEIPKPQDLDSSPPEMAEASLEAFKTHALYEGMPASALGSAALVAILSISHWNIIGHGALIFWTILILSAIFLRTITWYLWRQYNQLFSTSYWLTVFRAGSWLAGGAWGSSAFLMFANFNPSYQALLAYTIAGVSSGSFTTLAFDKKAAIGFVCLAIFPLTLRLFMENGPIAIPMGIMSIIYLVFVVSAAARARQSLEDQHEKKMRLLRWSKERVEQQHINTSINQAKTLFIKEGNSHNAFMSLLQDTLELTDSQFGFIGEIIRGQDSKVELQLHAIRQITQDKQLIQFYLHDNEFAPEHSAATVKSKDIPFANSILYGKPIISNDPGKDLREGGLANNHPSLSALCALPIFIGSSQVALLMLANRPKGYHEQLTELIKPVSATLAQFFEAILHQRQQKAYEIQLHNNAKHTQAILDEVFDAIITTDQYGIIKSFNHAAEMIFGYRARETIDSSINNLIPKTKSTDSAEGNKADQTILDGQEQIGVRRNGKEFPITLATSTITIEGEPLIISVVRDLSESKRNEELKNQFISTLNHELRTPLTAIAGALGILHSAALGNNNDQQQKLISIAMQNSMRLQGLINDLLDIDKLIANKMELDVSAHCIQEIVNKAIEIHQTYAAKTNVIMQLTSAPEKLMVYGDSRRIHQVLSNLLSNAAKFSPPDSSIDIHISQTGKFAKVTVTDRGDGIPESFKHKIFQRFMQADSSDTRQQGGSGLGLAISKELVQKMGGNIGFISKEGKGSSFYFELPLVEDNRPPVNLG